jgi:four helix bundle protein
MLYALCALGGRMKKFRFEDMEIWKMAIDITDKLFDIADQLEERHLFRFAEQLRGAGLSISNNIAEGSGSSSKKDFSNFLNIARRSAYECANILFVLHKRNLINETTLDTLLESLDHLCRKITNFQKGLWKRNQ